MKQENLNTIGARLSLLLAALLGGTWSNAFGDSTANPAEDLSEPASLVRAAERAIPSGVERNADGQVVMIVLPRELCNRTNLATAAKISGLRELRIQGGLPDPAGIRSLAASRSLTSLSFACSGQLPSGVLAAVTNVPNIQSLQLIAADAASPDEYHALMHMTNLTQLVIKYCRNFGDGEFRSLAYAPALRSIRIESDDLRPGAAAIVDEFAHLTNAVLAGKVEWHTNLHPHLKIRDSSGGQ